MAVLSGAVTCAFLTTPVRADDSILLTKAPLATTAVGHLKNHQQAGQTTPSQKVPSRLV
jgi:hypothetical protein